LSPPGDVDHIDRRVDQLGAEAGRQVVAARLQKDDRQIRVPFDSSSSASKFIDASSRMAVCGQPPCLDADDAIGG
jgi:hypothetical protein